VVLIGLRGFPIVDVWLVVGLLAGAFLPPLFYVAWVRNQERYHREPWGSVLKAFGWGASGAIVLTLIISVIVAEPSEALKPVVVSSAVYGAVVVAPIVEEAAKALGLRWVNDRHVEVEDGFIYGAAAGLGFSATENVVYGISALVDGGVTGLVTTLVIRAISSSFLHATASGVLGYAIWKHRAGESTVMAIPLLYLGAVAVHSAFNLAASVPLFLTFLAAMALAIGGFAWVRHRVRALDAR
jgi:RsiW-degrading membrane proteinase PrsW (M82 family)